MSWSAIAQLETGRRKHLRPGTLAALAGSLGVTTDYLVAGRSASAPMFEHRALLYRGDREFLDVAAPFLQEGVERGEATLAVSSSRNIGLLQERLGEHCEHVEFALHSRFYSSPLGALNRYREFVDARLDQGCPWVRIVGQPVWDGRSEEEARIWTRYESLLNLIFSASPLTIVCPYDVRALDPVILGHARATHPRTIEYDALSASSHYVDPGGFVLDELS